ncbi:hypothetical protein HOLleu_36023 [Holothuria leucospilota]|uniref:Uncharacterized protein n=1 Tax=Holothuria leucospilota TaxID=206669 RepID=A0A9Q1BED7_HOLLE|nr:hypothetical protein HOLleu_36023 [Holothuria leucospilota]
MIHDIEGFAPNVVTIINGDFNHAILKSTSVYYYQHVICPKKESANLVSLYSNVKDAYTSALLASLGQSESSCHLDRGPW